MDIQGYVKKIIEGMPVKSTYLFGSYGVGKTYTLKALKTELENHKIYETEFIVWTDYIVALKKAMNSDYTDFGFPSRSRLVNSKVLFIDDIGGEMPSDWEMREILFPLLNYRIDNKLTTFFTSNFSLIALKEYYEKKCDPVAVGRVIDRIQGLAQQEKMEGENLRHKKMVIS